MNVQLQTHQARPNIELTAGKSRPQLASPGCLVINADDWGQDDRTTNRIRECFRHHVLSSASGMVFMEDSERAANIAREQGFDIGLHLNLSASFTAPTVRTRLATHHQRIREYLRSSRVARLLYHPGLANSFEYVVACQLEEFTRLYGGTPDRIDGHHHMHLSANVLLPALLPPGTIVRRHFSHERGEKIIRNSLFRLFLVALMRRKYKLTDYLFSLSPVMPRKRMQRIFGLAQHFVVELETHPINAEEYRFLIGGEVLRWTHDRPPAPNFGGAIALGQG